MIIKLCSEIYAINVCKFHSRSQFKHVPKIDLHDKKERKKIKARILEEEQTTQWPKEKGQTTIYNQNRRRTDNTMAKRKRTKK
jgi:hypothetical protein